uniref:Uncharacterized protein n=1 Tax=Anguilla anguilla TaxID=7936 RepID=A0A0E9S081_ANGAN
MIFITVNEIVTVNENALVASECHPSWF